MRSIVLLPFLFGGLLACSKQGHDSTLQSEQGNIAARVFTSNLGKVYKGTPVGRSLPVGNLECYVVGPSKAGDPLQVEGGMKVFIGKDMTEALFAPSVGAASQRSFKIPLELMKRDGLLGRITRIKGTNDFSNESVYVEFEPEAGDRLVEAGLRYGDDNSEGAGLTCTGLKEIEQRVVAEAKAAFEAPFPGVEVSAATLTDAFDKECLEKAKGAIENWLDWNTEEGFWGESEIGGGYHKILQNKADDGKMIWYIEYQYSTAVGFAYGQRGTWAVETRRDASSGACAVNGKAELKRRVHGRRAMMADRQ